MPAFVVNRLIFPVQVNDTIGLVEIPVKGKVNVVVPQYVRCPNICHLETIIMIYVMKELEREGYGDKVL